MNADVAILIIGAGATGIGAAWRLQELGHDDWLLVDAADTPGGLAASVVDDRGFTWDLGGHVVFSHFDCFDALMDTWLKGEWLEHNREAWVWMRERFIPYPLQHNVWRLPPDEVERCVNGVRAAAAPVPQESHAKNFHEWIVDTFGTGLAEVFMLPYNRKVWAYEPTRLSCEWTADRVAPIDLDRMLDDIQQQRDDRAWGPNGRFRFPRRGGTGAIWRAGLERLPADRVRFNHRITRVSLDSRTAIGDDGSTIRYGSLLSTMPLNVLLSSIDDRPALAAKAREFLYSSSHIIGVGVEGTVPESLRTKSWIYFPEPDVPFYRVTVFSNYSPWNVPDPSRYWSLLCEVSESSDKRVDAHEVVDDTIRGLRACGLMPRDAAIASRWHRRVEYGYPTPFLGRDGLLDPIDAELRRARLWSRGRLGGWKYEVSNQDHSLMQGIEAIDNILFDAEETTYRHPDLVNAKQSRLTPEARR